MTILAPPPSALPEAFLALSDDEKIELLCKADPGVWAQYKRGFVNAAIHWEWYRYARTAKRLAIVAPREHAKTECFTVNTTAWRSIYSPGTWTYVFAQTLEQAQEMKGRIDQAILEARPDLVVSARIMSKNESVYANRSRITVAGAGKAVRGAHPDVIIGDDVLEEKKTLTRLQRDRTSRWWFGTVANMAHPGKVRTLNGGARVQFPATRIILVGTPFHPDDLLMGMKKNALYQFRRYAAEFRPEDLVEGLAVDVG